MADAGVLVVAGTPIGDIADATPRLRQLLATADVVAAEDTRRLRRLAARLEVEITGKVVSYHEHNEDPRTAGLVEQMQAGQTVLLVTDAGTPSVSDPGYRLVTACVAAGIAVTTAPGPSAALAALVVSGLPVDRFCFEGFLPRKSGQRRQRLRNLAAETRTMVFYEAPHRLAEVLADMAEAWGDHRPGVVCRELTKTYEEVRRGGLAELAQWARDGVRGEVTLVIGGRDDAAADVSDEELQRAVREAEAAGISRKDAVTSVANSLGIPRRRVYQAAHQGGRNL